MPEENIPSDNELEERKEGLEHVETKPITSERKAVLSCVKCNTEQDFPECENCGEQLSLEGDKLVCCDKQIPIPIHCNEPMVPKIV